MTAQGKRVLVVGGETLLGRAITVGLAEAGADVAIASFSNETKAEFAINSALNELWALGRRGVALAIDATDAAQLRGAVAQAEAELGRLDAAVAVGGQDVALDELRAALPGRDIVALAPDADALAALDGLLQRLQD